jgi:hypothetical protein
VDGADEKVFECINAFEAIHSKGRRVTRGIRDP